jgi:DNA-binding response OmpR family regulator
MVLPDWRELARRFISAGPLSWTNQSFSIPFSALIQSFIVEDTFMIKGRILCTEDDADSREMLSVLLTASGYQVVCIAEPTEALRLAQEEQFDLFLLDNWLPELSGVQLTRLIREFNISTPIIFYSGAAHEHDRHEAFAAGAQAYLYKPLAVEELISEIDKFIELSKAAQLNLLLDKHQ